MAALRSVDLNSNSYTHLIIFTDGLANYGNDDFSILKKELQVHKNFLRIFSIFDKELQKVFPPVYLFSSSDVLKIWEKR